MDIKERIAETTRTMWYKQDFQTDDDWSEIAEAILSLTYPCSTCKGKGEVIPFGTDVEEVCPDCNGTGKGSPMLAVLSENQKLPVNPHSEKDTAYYLINVYNQAQQDMIEQGWRKTV